MAKFDVEGARRAGYTETEIADYLAGEEAFDAAAARAAGYTDAEILSHLSGPSTPVKKPRTGLDKATQIAGITTGALLPYATAAGVGALATGVPTGGLGAPIGAAGGVLSLGVADLGTALYNLGGSIFGYDGAQLPSQTIRKGYESVGIGRSPETRGEQVYSDVLEAGTGAFSQGKAAQNLFKTGSQPVQNFMRDMGQNVRGQTVAGAFAGGAPSVASNYFDVTNPYALAGLSLVGGTAGNKIARPNAKPVTAAELKKESDLLYKQMRDEGIQVSPQAMTDLAAQVRTKIKGLPYDPDNYTVVNKALQMLDVKAGKPLSYNMLDDLRRQIRDLPYSPTGQSLTDANQKTLISAIDDAIDDYMEKLTPEQTTFGGGQKATVNFGGREFNLGFGAPTRDTSAAAALLKKARDVRRRSYLTDTLEGAFKKATDASKGQDNPRPFAKGLRDEFKSIADNDRKLLKFDQPTQDLIKKVADGTITQKGLQMLGSLSPSAALFGADLKSVKALAKNALYGTSAYVSPVPTAIVAGTTTAAKGIANQMTKGQAKRALVSAAQPGGGVKPGGPGYFALSPIAQQNVLAQERAKKAEERRRMGF
jgi:hypothetical protein